METDIEPEETEETPDWGELNPLARYLDGKDAPAFPWSASEADGLLAAIAAGPEDIPESEWLDALFDADPGCSSKEIPADVLDGLRKRLGTVIAQLSAGDDSFRPMLLFEEDMVSPGDWANGFLTALALREEAWEPLVRHPNAGILMVPILSLHFTPDDEPFLDLTAEEQDQAAEAAPNLLPATVQAIHDFFLNRRTRRTQRQATSPPPAGRNDPCPCGSGKKYKKCCL